MAVSSFANVVFNESIGIDLLGCLCSWSMTGLVVVVLVGLMAAPALRLALWSWHVAVRGLLRGIPA